MKMRSFQVMRCGRRTTPTQNELVQSIIQANNSTPTHKHRTSTFSFDSIQRQSSVQCDDHDESIVNRYDV